MEALLWGWCISIPHIVYICITYRWVVVRVPKNQRLVHIDTRQYIIMCICIHNRLYII